MLHNNNDVNVNMSAGRLNKSKCNWQSYQEEHGCLLHFLRILALWWLGNIYKVW